MNESPNKRAIIVGIFIVLGLGLLISGIMIIGNVHETFKNKIKVVALFDDVNGLQKGSNVWFSGVKVGIVSKVEFHEKSKVEIIMKIETGVQQYIRKNAKVKISTDGLIGNKILVIYGGSETYGMVTEGDTLGVEKTFSSEDMMKTLQENNENFLAITNNFKSISQKLASGEGTIGKLLNDNTVYEGIEATTVSLQEASAKAQKLIGTLAIYSEGLNRKGTLANQLVTDTVVFNSLKTSVKQLQQIADTSFVFIAGLKAASNNPNSPVGILLHDEATGAQLKVTIENLESSSEKLKETLKSIQESALLSRFFKKKKEKAEKK